MDGLMYFNDYGIVGKVGEYETPESFLDAVSDEFARDFDPERAHQVKRVYVRWVARCPRWLDCDPDSGAYITCEPGRGSFECFVIED